MEKNSLLISCYNQTKKGYICRQYYVVYGGVYVLVDLKTTKDFIKDKVKSSPVYAWEELKKVIVGECRLDDIQVTTYKEYKDVYCGV